MTDDEMINALLRVRNKRLKELKRTTPMEEIVQGYLLAKVSRQYKSIVKDANIDAGVEVIWGKGGGQTKRIKEYTKNGTHFLHIVDLHI